MLEPFPDRYHKALDDAQLRHNLLVFQRRWRATRDAAVDQIDFFEAKRQQLEAVKDAVVARLPEFVDEFATAAMAAGAQVHIADTPEEAANAVIGLAKESVARRIAKSKSMVSEEIDLNHRLEAVGLTVVETDLGEWIVQLAGERPSHIIAPAIHKNRRQVADLFAAVTGEAVSREDIGEQVEVARRRLRQEFLDADMGISGANALVAETGGIMLVTNEGNAELVTSIPRIHVVLAGIEKILPTVDDAMLELELLAPSATGQPATSFVSFITGPPDPDRELHIILIDNGRSAMRASPLFDEALRCIRCGACSNVCPSYGVVGGHVFGYVYSGAIGLVNTPFHHGIEHDAGPQSMCVSCNACQTVCPVDIPLPRQILDARAWTVREKGLPFAQRVGLVLWSRPRVAHALLRSGIRLQRPLKRGKFLMLPLASSLTTWRKLPVLTETPFRDRLEVLQTSRLPEPLGAVLRGLTIAYFVQCVTDWLYPEMGEAIAEVLRSLGADVVFPSEQHCCGLPAADSGDTAHARQMARQTIESLERCGADYVVSGGTSCVVALTHEYQHLFRDEPEWQSRALALAARTLDFTSFMMRVVRLDAHSLPVEIEGPITYHYFCQSHNVLDLKSEPIDLLEDVCGLNLVPLAEANVCCGFGGSVSFTRPEMCKHILQRKLENVDQSGARVLVTDNPGCIMHLRGGIAASGRDVRVMHIAEIVAAGIRQRRGSRDIIGSG